MRKDGDFSYTRHQGSIAKMERLGEILARVLSQEKLQREYKHGPVFQLWSQLVGPWLAQRCWPVSIRKGVLLVRVAGPLWMQELQLQKAELLERIAALVGPDRVLDIRFTTRGAKSSALRRARGLSGGEVLPPRPLSDEERAWVDEVSGPVQDPALRSVLRRILERHLRDPRKG